MSDNSGLATVFAVIAFALFIVWCASEHAKHQAQCEAKDGIYYCGYKSSCLCLAPGTVLP